MALRIVLSPRRLLGVIGIVVSHTSLASLQLAGDEDYWRSILEAVSTIERPSYSAAISGGDKPAPKIIVISKLRDTSTVESWAVRNRNHNHDRQYLEWSAW